MHFRNAFFREDSGYLSPEKKLETTESPLKTTPTLPTHIPATPASTPYLPFGLGGTYLPSHPTLLGAGLGLPHLPLSPHISPSMYSFMNILRATQNQPGLLSTLCAKPDLQEQQHKRIRVSCESFSRIFTFCLARQQPLSPSTHHVGTESLASWTKSAFFSNISS